MPAIIRPQPSEVGRTRAQLIRSSTELLSRHSYRNRHLPIIHSSFTDLDSSSRGVAPHENGFVHTVVSAFQQDLHLQLRPDDVWLAILSQLSFFVNGHSEELRSFFVEHEGKELLEVNVNPASLLSVDINVFVERMVRKVRDRLRDATIAEWMLPRFSTTTQIDATVAAMMFLSSVKEYFDFQMRTGCGFPSVTLHGTKDDWKLILQSITHMADLGDIPGLEDWIKCLGCVLDNMIAGFDEPDSEKVKDFWMRAVHVGGKNGSGALFTLSGWLTAFCFWQPDGTRTYAYTDEELLEEFSMRGNPEEWKRLELAGVGFPVISREKIPSACVEFPVRVVGEPVEKDTVIVAGLVGMEVLDEDASTMRSRPGWWMLLKDDNSSSKE